MKYKVVILFVCCLLVGALRAIAQEEDADAEETETPVKVDKRVLQRMMQWTGIFTLYSDLNNIQFLSFTYI